MLVILDTSILIDIEQGNPSVVARLEKLIEELPNPEPAIAWVSFFEFYYGAMGSESEQKSLEFLNKFYFIGMDKEATRIFTSFKKAKSDVKDFDLLIASIALAQNAMLITRDSDFKRVKGLNLRLL